MNNTITLQVGVKIILRNSEGGVLLLRRSEDKYPDVLNRWDLVGGRIDPGTPLLDNLAREVKEETGLGLLDEPALIAAQDILRKPGFHVVRLTYLGYAEDGEIVLDSEHDMYRWYSCDELKDSEEIDKYLKELIVQGVLEGVIECE